MATSAPKLSAVNGKFSPEHHSVPTSGGKKQSRKSKTKKSSRFEEELRHLSEAREWFAAQCWSVAFKSMKCAKSLPSDHVEHDGLIKLFRDVSQKFIETEEYELAWEALSLIKSVYPDVVLQKKIEVIKCFFKENSLEKAIEKSVGLTSENPTFGKAWLQRAEIHAALQDWDAAIGAIENYMTIETLDNEDSNVNVPGIMGYYQGQKAEGIKAETQEAEDESTQSALPGAPPVATSLSQDQEQLSENKAELAAGLKDNPVVAAVSELQSEEKKKKKKKRSGKRGVCSVADALPEQLSVNVADRISEVEAANSREGKSVVVGELGVFPSVEGAPQDGAVAAIDPLTTYSDEVAVSKVQIEEKNKKKKKRSGKRVVSPVALVPPHDQTRSENVACQIPEVEVATGPEGKSVLVGELGVFRGVEGSSQDAVVAAIDTLPTPLDEVSCSEAADIKPNPVEGGKENDVSDELGAVSAAAAPAHDWEQLSENVVHIAEVEPSAGPDDKPAVTQELGVVLDIEGAPQSGAFAVIGSGLPPVDEAKACELNPAETKEMEQSEKQGATHVAPAPLPVQDQSPEEGTAVVEVEAEADGHGAVINVAPEDAAEDLSTVASLLSPADEESFSEYTVSTGSRSEVSPNNPSSPFSHNSESSGSVPESPFVRAAGNENTETVAAPSEGVAGTVAVVNVVPLSLAVVGDETSPADVEDLSFFEKLKRILLCCSRD